jgi:outer membrane protein OmpA-like peptidoglycan-associated protein
MSRRHLVSIAAFAVAMLGASAAHAQTQVQGFSVERLYMSPAGGGWWVMDDLSMHEKIGGEDSDGPVRGLGLSINGGVAGNPLSVASSDGTQHLDVVHTLSFVDLGIVGEFFGNSRAYMNIGGPVAAHGDSGTIGGFSYTGPDYSASNPALNDFRIGWDTRFLGKFNGPFRMGAGAQLYLPLDGNRGDYVTDKTVRAQGRLLFAGESKTFMWAGHLGVHVRPLDDELAGSPRGSELLFGVAAGPRFAMGDWQNNGGFRSIIVGPEIFGATAFNKFLAKEETAAEVLLTARFEFGALQASIGRIKVGVGTALNQHFGAPEWRFVLGVDGVNRDEDPDKDDIWDGEDACPKVAGVYSDDPAQNGCPPPDRDGDGISDRADACPDTRGESSSDPKKNGCPPPPPPPANPDRDGDGIANEKDACPDQAGPPNADPSKNGCPAGAPPPQDPDRDHDGIPNVSDACPDLPGVPDPDPMKNGCPKATVSGGQIQISEEIEFQTASAVIVKDSEDVLEQVAKIMTDNPQMKKVRVEGHTDNVGPAAYNKLLSQQRADSVVKWLVAHGIDASRLSAVGLGDTQPLVPNDTEAHRHQNRRVEFHIEDGGGTSTAPPPPPPPPPPPH